MLSAMVTPGATRRRFLTRLAGSAAAVAVPGCLAPDALTGRTEGCAMVSLVGDARTVGERWGRLNAEDIRRHVSAKLAADGSAAACTRLMKLLAEIRKA